MRRSLCFFPLLFLALLVHLPGGLVCAEERYIQVRSTKIRSGPHHWSSGVGGADYGDRIEILSEDDGWLKVRSASGIQGYLHQSATTSRKVVLGSAAAANRAPDDVDAILAGKGFSKEVEQKYASGGTPMNYPAVDQMEALKVSESEVAAFIKSGNLNHPG